jgi:hypothetical protein
MVKRGRMETEHQITNLERNLRGECQENETFSLERKYLRSVSKGLKRRLEGMTAPSGCKLLASDFNKELSLFPYIYLIHSLLHVSTCVYISILY